MTAPPSPLESLTAFAIAFSLGFLSALGLKAYVEMIKPSHAGPPHESSATQATPRTGQEDIP